MPSAELYEALHRAADGLVGPFRRAWVAWVAGLAGALDAPAFRAALMQGDVTGAVAVLDWPAQGMRLRMLLWPIVLEGVRRGAGVAGASLPDLIGDKALGLGITWDLLNPNAVEAAARVAAALVTSVSDSTREALRGVIVQAITEGADVPSTARRLRPLVGLNAPQATAYWNYLRGLEEKRAKKELTPQRVAVLAERYAARLHRQRATLIARTETLRAANLGQQLSWQRAAEAGALVPAEWERFWIVTRDDRTCPHCRKMLEHPGVALNQSFETDFGLVLTPPMHPSCRCALALRPAEEG